MRINQLTGLLRSLAIYHNPLSQLRWRRFYGQVLTQGELCFDIGAHVGTRARAMRGAGARVVALEPQWPFSAYLQRTLPRDITVLPAAAGRESTQGTLAVSSRHPTVSTLKRDFVEAGKTADGFEHVDWDDAQTVSIVTLDDLIECFGPPAYVKIDVEGSEEDVLAGLSHPVDLISVEYLPALPMLALTLVDLLTSMGNDQFNIVRGESGRFLWPDWQDKDATMAWLDLQDPSAVSGDIFARRPKPREAP